MYDATCDRVILNCDLFPWSLDAIVAAGEADGLVVEHAVETAIRG